MNWIAELCDLYDKNQHLAGRMGEDHIVLLPPYHTTVAAQITVTIDGDGNFLRAETVPDEDKLTIIPVTEKSASRTAGIEPHPLCDNLKYLAADYNQFVKGKDCSKNHLLYMEHLKEWADSSYCHSKVKAVYQYLEKGTLMKDLNNQGIFIQDESGKISEKAKIQIVAQTDAFIRFQIDTGEVLPEDALMDDSGSLSVKCWKDCSLQQNYIEYCRSQHKETGLSYLTGDLAQISWLQPKKIRNEGDGAKLISANDESNYTYRGRFANKEEAFSIGYEDSQKAHNALKWLLRKQGTNYGSLYLVTWESDLKTVADWQSSSDELCIQAEALPDEVSEEEEEFSDEVWDEEEEQYKGTGEAGAMRFRQAIKGYRKNLTQTSNTMIMAFDAATTGRLAMVECRSYDSSRYLDSLQSWYERCEWRQPKSSKERGRYIYYGMVGIKDAAELLYGTEQNGYFSLSGKEERYKDVVKRWMPCILDKKEVPADMVRLAVQRASSPVSFESRFLWERILALACSLVKQQIEKRYGEVYTMALDKKCRKREYLFGRLLAVADRIEYRTFDKEDGRETNAKRYMSAFSQHPYRTWKVLEEKLEPYFMRLKAPERLVYQRLLDDICNLFEIEDFENDTALNGLYLLGFHNQSYALKEKKKEEEE
ncbi:type I-C CRISPR-associated protein Cas8c/Csd1 [Eisenbergiella porci]|uniref:type I-C CRISPR-associated protein Cas8c/Csd1 n=1 Tax=Eisenbergiella porci TaxID=2652274 RepID=UPI002A804FBF|nr:type I-C CRISPR-associated protein Cas8c/Csd1 [Eisenbergiella porci]